MSIARAVTGLEKVTDDAAFAASAAEVKAVWLRGILQND